LVKKLQVDPERAAQLRNVFARKEKERRAKERTKVIQNGNGHAGESSSLNTGNVVDGTEGKIAVMTCLWLKHLIRRCSPFSASSPLSPSKLLCCYR
jgi:hypothetical protein